MEKKDCSGREGVESVLKFYTIGHSTRSIEEFVSALKAFRVEVLVDIRAFPVSRRNPQFNRENLEGKSCPVPYSIPLAWQRAGRL